MIKWPNLLLLIGRKIHPVLESNNGAQFLQIGINEGQNTKFLDHCSHGAKLSNGFRVYLTQLPIASGISFSMIWNWKAEEPYLRYRTFKIHIIILSKVYVPT